MSRKHRMAILAAVAGVGGLFGLGNSASAAVRTWDGSDGANWSY